MKRIFVYAMVLCLGACSSQSPEPVAQENTSTQPVQAVVQTESPTKKFEGVYRFDVDSYRKALQTQAKAKGKAVDSKALEMANFFKPIKMSVQEDLVRVSFSSEVLEGKLAVLEQNDSQTKAKVIPSKDGQSESILYFQNGTVTLERDGNSNEPLYFKKID